MAAAPSHCGILEAIASNNRIYAKHTFGEHRLRDEPPGAMIMARDLFYGARDASAPSAARADSDRVLRNTYWLLALSMIPTVLGAWIGVASGLARAMTPGVG